MTSPLATLEELLALSEAMIRAAESGDWEALAGREAERRALVDSLPASLTSGFAPAAQARSLIETCLRCDASIRPLVEARLDELRVVLRAPHA